MADNGDRTNQICKYAKCTYFFIEKTKEEAHKAEAAAKGGLEDDDVWGDVDDVSRF